MMQALVYRMDGTPVPNSFLPNTTQPGEGTAELNEGPGEFYTVVNAAGFGWEVFVDELR